MDENELLKKYNSLYLDIIMRYRDYIEEKEGLYIAELPKLITPDDESVKLLANSIKEKFPSYKYEDNFVDAAGLAYNYVTGSIATVSLPIQFWQRPSDTIRHGAGEIFDKAVLLCSVLIGMGCPSTKVAISVGETVKSFAVYFEHENEIVSMDIEKGVEQFGNMNELLKHLGIKEDSDVTAYEFNDKMYKDLA